MLQREPFRLGGLEIPVFSVNTVIVGSGAAALNCAEHLYRFLQEGGEAHPEELICIAPRNDMGGGSAQNAAVGA